MIQQSLSKNWRFNKKRWKDEKMHYVSKLLSNRVTLAKCKTHVIKEHLKMSYNHINKSYGFSYDETLFITHQKFPIVKIDCSYSKEGTLYWGLFINEILKSLMMVVEME